MGQLFAPVDWAEVFRPSVPLVEIRPALQALSHPEPLLLVRNGRMLRANMRRELMSEEELWSALRSHGVSKLAQVRAAYLEGDGKVSVLRR